MGGVEIVEVDQEAITVPFVLFLYCGYLLLWCYAEFFGSEHYGCAMGVVSTDIEAIVPTGFLEAYPDVCLHLFQQVSQVQGAIGVGQSTGYQDFTWGLCGHDHFCALEKGRYYSVFACAFHPL